MWLSSSSIITPPQIAHFLFLSMAGCVTWKSVPSRSKRLGLAIQSQCDHSNTHRHPRLFSETKKEIKEITGISYAVVFKKSISVCRVRFKRLARDLTILTCTETCEGVQLEQTETLWWHNPEHRHMDLNTHGWSTKFNSLLFARSEVNYQRHTKLSMLQKAFCCIVWISVCTEWTSRKQIFILTHKPER